LTKLNVLLCLSLVMMALTAWSMPSPSKAFKLKKPSASIEGFALNLRDYLNAGDTYYLLDTIDVASLTRPLLTPENTAKFTEKQLNQQVQNLIVSRFIGSLEASNTWRYLNYRTYKKQHFLNFHIEYDTVEEYIEFKIEQINGKWHITDWYLYSTELWASDAINIYTKRDQAEMRSVYQNAAALTGAGNNLADVFTQLPKEARHNRFIHSVYIMMATGLEQSAYLEAMRTLYRHTPDTSLTLSKLGYYNLTGNNSQYLKLVKRLQTRLGGDYNLSLSEIEVLFAQNKKQQAAIKLAKIVEHHDIDIVLYTTLVLLVQEGHYNTAINVLDVLESDYLTDISAEYFAGIPELDDFIASAPFHQWLARKR